MADAAAAAHGGADRAGARRAGLSIRASGCRPAARALALVIDNGWASAPDWERRVATAERLIADASVDRRTRRARLHRREAERRDRPLRRGGRARPLERRRAAPGAGRPAGRLCPRRRRAQTTCRAPRSPCWPTAWPPKATSAAFASLLGKDAASVRLGRPRPARPGRPDRRRERGRRLPISRRPRAADPGAAPGDRRRLRRQGPAHRRRDAHLRRRRDDRAPATFTRAVRAAQRLRLDRDRRRAARRPPCACSTRIRKRRRVGLLSQAEADQAQPLLSPLYYIRRALEPFADLVEPPSPDLAEAIPQLLEQKPAMIVMADVGTIPAAARAAAGRLGEERRHAGALRRLPARRRRQ